MWYFGIRYSVFGIPVFNYSGIRGIQLFEVFNYSVFGIRYSVNGNQSQLPAFTRGAGHLAGVVLRFGCAELSSAALASAGLACQPDAASPSLGWVLLLGEQAR